MEEIINVANYICEEYLRQSGEPIDELKLQKLLYFSQRESLAVLGCALFSEAMEGWIHGPVSTDVRREFDLELGMFTVVNDISIGAKRIINNALEEYGHLASWKLRELSHCEISWQRSREGLSVNSRGNKNINIEDIREDAKKIRPFDHTWGMYYDEFDDYDGEVSQ